MKRIALITVCGLSVAGAAIAQTSWLDEKVVDVGLVVPESAKVALAIKSISKTDIGSPPTSIVVINFFAKNTSDRPVAIPEPVLVSPDGERYAKEENAPVAPPVTTPQPVGRVIQPGQEVNETVTFRVAPGEFDQPNWTFMIGDPNNGVRVVVR